MSIRRILVPHDGGQMSDKALLHATELARSLGSEITVLYVIDEIEVPPTLLLGNDRTLIAKAKRSVTNEIKLRWSRFAEGKLKTLASQRIKASSDVRIGDPGDQILKYAKEMNADLIVMGSRRLEGVSRLMMALGSVARKVSEKASCPVTLVH